MIEDGKDSSMAIAASPDDGTNVKERGHAAANMLELMRVQNTAEYRQSRHILDGVSCYLKNCFHRIVNHDIEPSHSKCVVLTRR